MILLKLELNFFSLELSLLHFEIECKQTKVKTKINNLNFYIELLLESSQKFVLLMKCRSSFLVN